MVWFRRQHVPFDVAFDRALGLVAFPESKRDAGEWRRAVQDTREGWRAAFELWPQEPREAAVGELARILTDELRRAAA